jgi:uncharacterized protein YndB with AHSA1/START domain
MLKKIALVLVLAIAALVVAIATRPSDFRIERRQAMAAPPEVVFPYLNDFRKWQAWSPWEKLDPAQQRTFGGPASGVGAQYAWQGNDQVGSGRMTIIESEPSRRVDIDLEFLQPMQAKNRATFELQPTGEGVHVRWTMTGHNNFVAKAFHMFVDVDELAGKDFELGLHQLKTLAEADAAKLRQSPEAARTDNPQ